MFVLLYMFLKEQKQVPNIVTMVSTAKCNDEVIGALRDFTVLKQTDKSAAAADLDKVLGHFWRKVPQKSKLEGLLKESLY